MSAIEAADEYPYQVLFIRVSSRHLSLASPVFKRILQTKFVEGQRLSSQGHTELSLLEENPPILLVLLNLIHGHTREVPRKVELWILTKLAILVDKYELLEATRIVVDYWFQSL